MKIAVITGASSGYGREFARQLDDRGYDQLWVVARRKERLLALSDSLKTPIRAIPLDLTADGATDTLKEMFEAEKPQICALVNASGYGYFDSFQNQPLETSLNMMQLNNTALVSLCYHALPYMEKGGEIYNIASSSAFQPVPYIGVYAATKSFVLSFTRSLAAELKPRGIKAIAVCPHWTKTEFFDTAVKDDDVIVYYNFYEDMTKVVATAIKNMARGRDLSLCSVKLKAQVLLTRLLPHRLVMKVWCTQQKKPY